MPIRHLLSLSELGTENLTHLVESSVGFASGARSGEAPLEGKTVGIYFRKSSTRTRTSFTVGAMKLGADVIAYGPQDLQIVTGETLRDTSRVLSGYLEALVVRTNASMDEMMELASQEHMAVINAMSETEHPTQAVADFSVIQESLGRLQGVQILYMGEGNNTASALAYGVAQIPGMRLTLLTPEGYGLPAEILEQAGAMAAEHGSGIEQHHDLGRLPTNVDVVYTTRWQTMGVSKGDPNWKEKFRPYSVTPSLMARASKPSGTIFLHDLPAVRGDDVMDEVLDGPQSLAWRQARHKLFGAMAVLEWCVVGAHG